MIIDLRSDAVSKPSKEMIEVMMSAKVGDDVFGDDPSITELENYSADLFGKEAGLFCPSGIMCNQVALKIHTPAGKKFLCNEFSHLYYYETGGPAYLAGAIPHLVKHERGKMSAEEIGKALSAGNDIQLVSIESTVNKGGGGYYTLNEIKEISEICRKHNVTIHLDGARIFNALTETGNKAFEIGQYFDTINFCLSKGLGAPVGSVMVSAKENILNARATRNKFGGGMRQAGYLAAAGLYALKNNINRLKEDHKRAKVLEIELKNLNYVKEVLPVDTNIIIFRLTDKVSSVDFLKKLFDKNIKAVPFGEQTIRMVTHIDFTDDMLAETSRVLKSLVL